MEVQRFGLGSWQRRAQQQSQRAIPRPVMKNDARISGNSGPNP
jgi:hypothetical protein